MATTNIKNMIEALLDSAKKGIEPPSFTGYIQADESLAGWLLTLDEDYDIKPEDSYLYKLYMQDRQTLLDFIKDGDFQLSVTLRDEDEDEKMHRDKLTEWLEQINDLDQWHLVYLVIEMENRGIPNKEKYPRSLWEFLDEDGQEPTAESEDESDVSSLSSVEDGDYTCPKCYKQCMLCFAGDLGDCRCDSCNDGHENECIKPRCTCKCERA